MSLGGHPSPPRLGYIPLLYVSTQLRKVTARKWLCAAREALVLLGASLTLTVRLRCSLAGRQQFHNTQWGYRWPRWIRRKTGPVCKSVTMVGHLGQKHEYCPNTKVPSTGKRSDCWILHLLPWTFSQIIQHKPESDSTSFAETLHGSSFVYLPHWDEESAPLCVSVVFAQGH